MLSSLMQFIKILLACCSATASDPVARKVNGCVGNEISAPQLNSNNEKQCVMEAGMAGCLSVRCTKDNLWLSVAWRVQTNTLHCLTLFTMIKSIHKGFKGQCLTLFLKKNGNYWKHWQNKQQTTMPACQWRLLPSTALLPLIPSALLTTS